MPAEQEAAAPAQQPREARAPVRRPSAGRRSDAPRLLAARRCAAAAAARRASRCSVSNGNRRSATRSNIHTCFPPGFGGVPAVALDSKGNLWVFQRADFGKPQLFKFDPNYKLILEVGNDVIGYQAKAHGMAVDAEDNVWITAAGTATVTKISPEGKLLLTDRRDADAAETGTKRKGSGCCGSR